MRQSFFIALVIALCLFFIGRKFYRQFKNATDPGEKTQCDGGCSGCSSPGRLSKTTKTPECGNLEQKNNPKL
ncbi:MAG: FeoB-associated Cys-rich membrane protein [Desulfoarculaceae bacterium]|nr:FeoB-associated Cys-rich membrane protein [Desulfoarculaceae bacterium]